MKISTLQKLGGMALIIGVLLLTSWAVCWTTILPSHESDPSILYLNSNWVWISALALTGHLLLIFGFTALYSRIYHNSGAVGLVGYLFIVLAYFFQAAQTTWELFVFPAIVSHAPSIALFRDNNFFLHPQIRLFGTLAAASVLLGFILFCWMLMKTKVFPKSAGILILCGTLIYTVFSVINAYIAVLGTMVFSAGGCILGIKMFQGAKE
jgi:hypothetical protein